LKGTLKNISLINNGNFERLVMAKFIEFLFPCTDCLVAAACKDRRRISKKDLLDGNSGAIRCLAVPMYDGNQSSHVKNLMECLAHLAWRISNQLNEDRDSKIPSGYRHFLLEHIRLFCYITNSTSWRGELIEVAKFDKLEIKNRVNRLASFLDWKE
jgi:hypothetical protein